MADLYQSGALHHAMGLQPPAKESQRATKGKESIENTRIQSSSLSLDSTDSAWKEADLGAEEVVYLGAEKVPDHKADTDDEGRYGIQHRSNKRRKKSHRSRDTAFVPKEEEGELEEGVVSDSSSRRGGKSGRTWAEYRSDSESEVEELIPRPPSSSKHEERRAYWNAKGGSGPGKERD